MFDDGDDPLSELVSFGNFWHGSCDTEYGFRNRLGVPVKYLNDRVNIPRQVYGTSPNYRDNVPAYSSHLVDFGTPELETPEDEAAIGKLWWNKTLLHGENKQYSVLGSYAFGSGNWPYKAPDGRTWLMYAKMLDSTTLAIYASPILSIESLSAAHSQEMLASITVPFYYTHAADDPWLYSNFNPKNGAQAAVHRWSVANMWIVEVEVSGGGWDDTSVNVALSLTRDARWQGSHGYVLDSEITYTPFQHGAQMYTSQGYPYKGNSIPYGGVEDTFYWAPDSRTYIKVYSFGEKHVLTVETLAIGYGADGTRLPITFEVDEMVRYTVSADQYPNPTPGTWLHSVTYTLRSGRASSTHNIDELTEIPDVFAGTLLGRSTEPIVTGNAPHTPGYDPVGTKPSICHVGALVFGLVRSDSGTPAGQTMLEMWAGHGFSGDFTSPLLMQSNQVRLAVDPVEGTYCPTTLYYF